RPYRPQRRTLVAPARADFLSRRPGGAGARHGRCAGALSDPLALPGSVSHNGRQAGAAVACVRYASTVRHRGLMALKCPREIMMPRTETQELTNAVQLYLDLMYDCDVGKFDKIFASTSQLHGFREGKMTCWPAAQYKEVLAGRKSPKAAGAPREEQVLLLDF